jgi:TM2 domain-containing membrane protein YozV
MASSRMPDDGESLRRDARGEYDSAVALARTGGLMNVYTLALFAHVVGAIGTFVGVSIWLFAAEALRRARRVGQVRALISLIQPSGVVALASIILLGVAGFYMARTAWGVQSTWIVVATISFLLLAPFGAFVIDPRLRALAKLIALAHEGPLPAALAARTHDPLVGIGLYTYVGVLLGIVFLMTTKPPLATSMLAMMIATALGLATGLALWLAARSDLRVMLQMRDPAG